MNGIQLLGFEVNVSSPSFQVFCLILGVFLVLVSFYLQLNWVLAQVIVVAESIWGLEPLKRSNFLIKGTKGVALSLFLFLAFFPGFVIAISFPGETWIWAISIVHGIFGLLLFELWCLQLSKRCYFFTISRRLLLFTWIPRLYTES
ncbi:hypothetical protein NC651_024984 [Populus alba x Populus x berolinensis]|nr:hypothetical protein NC651_024984 [Populus alba x Populus x berolinensis]